MKGWFVFIWKVAGVFNPACWTVAKLNLLLALVKVAGVVWLFIWVTVITILGLLLVTRVPFEDTAWKTFDITWLLLISSCKVHVKVDISTGSPAAPSGKDTESLKSDINPVFEDS